MKSAKIPHLYIRNGIYYYRKNNAWKSLRSRCKKEAFRQLAIILSGSMPALKDSSSIAIHTSLTEGNSELIANNSTYHTSMLIKAYLEENGNRWCAREYTRVKSALGFLPKGFITRQMAIDLKSYILESKTSTTFNRYLKYFNALYRWAIANTCEIIENPFEGLKIIEKRRSASGRRKAYTPEQLKLLYKLAEGYGKSDRRYWLIMIGRYTGARMNEICQLKPEDVTREVIYIRGNILKTDNSRRSIPIHSELIKLGLFEWVASCKNERLFHEWKPIKGSYSHQASRWFSRNNPFKSRVKGSKAEVDFHSLRHTVASEFKNAGVTSQFAAQILGHSNGNITYDRYGKCIDYKKLKDTIEIIGC